MGKYVNPVGINFMIPSNHHVTYRFKEFMKEKRALRKGYAFAKICGSICILICLPVLIGWLFHIDVLITWNNDWPTMKLNTCLALISCSVCVFLSPYYTVSKTVRFAGRIFSFFTFAVGLITLIEHFTNHTLIDEIFILDNLSNRNDIPGRPSLITSLTLITISGCLFFKVNKGNFQNGEDQYIFLIPFFLSLFGIFCYVYGAEATLKTAYTNISVQTALVVLLLCLSAIFVQPGRGWANIALSKTASGNLLRTIFIPNTILFPVLGFLRLRGELSGIYDTEFGVTILVTAEILFVGVALIVQGNRLYNLEQQVQASARKLEKTNAQLSRVNNDLDTFVYTASHDLKAPISNIEGLLQMHFDELPEEVKTNAGTQHVKEMLQTSIEKFRATIFELGTVAKMQMRKELEPVRLQQISEEVKLGLRELIEREKPEIEEDYSKAPSVYFSSKNLRSILQNLVSNAIKYRSPERKPLVKVTSCREGDFFVLSVQDNGLGIREEDKQRVFGMYHRLHTHVEGTGIGMGIVARIAENSGGSIRIDSKVGEGTTFHVYLKEEMDGLG